MAKAVAESARPSSRRNWRMAALLVCGRRERGEREREGECVKCVRERDQRRKREEE